MNFCLAHDFEEYDELSVGNGLDPLPRHIVLRECIT